MKGIRIEHGNMMESNQAKMIKKNEVSIERKMEGGNEEEKE